MSVGISLKSDGKCGKHCYGEINKVKIDAILKGLKNNDCTVTGNNPWDIDTQRYGVKLQSLWDESSSTFCIIVTDKNFYVPCSKIWDLIDSLINRVVELSESELEAALADG